jgi:DNA repair exonuclease SbcCD ATPase subunit
VAALLPLDSLDLIKRLSVDDKLRKNLVQRAEAYQTEKEKLESQKTATPDSKVAEKQTLDDRLKKLDAGLDQTNARIDEFREGTLGITTPLDTPGGPAKKPNLEWYTKHVPGLLLSWVLLSLGAPFWYDALKDSLKLRSVLAAKDDKDKDERQRSDPNLGPAATNPALAGQAAAGVIAVSALPVREDESGDPDNAVG